MKRVASQALVQLQLLQRVGRGRSMAQAFMATQCDVQSMDARLLARARRLALGVGSAAGVFGSVVGVGGGVLIAPVIAKACPNIPQRVISGTSLAAVITTGSTAGYVYWRENSVDTKSAMLLAAGAVITAPLGARATRRINSKALRTVLGYFLFVVAGLVPVKTLVFSHQNKHSTVGSLEQQGTDSSSSSSRDIASTHTHKGSERAAGIDASTPCEGDSAGSPSAPTWSLSPADAFIAATGVTAGFASGLLGIGGGTIVTPLLALATGMPQAMAVGTSLAAMVVPSFIGLMQHNRMGNVDWRMAAAMAGGTLVGSYVGSSFAVTLPPGVMEGCFALGMVLLGRSTLAGARAAAKRAGTVAAGAAK